MKTTRYIGNCQICEGDQKLHVGRMVHHGYQRPGDGAIRGDCPGVGQVPYEVSCDLVKSYKGNVAKRAATDAKTEAREATRTAIRKDFEAKFRALAADSNVTLANRQVNARGLLAEMEKTKYRNWLWLSTLECEEAFVALGLAVQDGVNGRGRPRLRWL